MTETEYQYSQLKDGTFVIFRVEPSFSIAQKKFPPTYVGIALASSLARVLEFYPNATERPASMGAPCCPNHPNRAVASPSSNLCGPCLMGRIS